MTPRRSISAATGPALGKTYAKIDQIVATLTGFGESAYPVRRSDGGSRP